MTTALVKIPLTPPLQVFSDQQNNCFKQQIAKLFQKRTHRNYDRDVGQLAEKLKERNVPSGHLGDVLEYMGRQSELLPNLVKDDDDFRIEQRRDLSQNTIEYLNRLQYDKLFNCRLCYTHAETMWCEFHKTHAYHGSRDLTDDTYVEHLNSDMGIVAFIEEYYHYLSSCDNKLEAKRVLKTLTNFESLTDLLASHNYTAEDADTLTYELMDFD
jgi:hypothetical protein